MAQAPTWIEVKPRVQQEPLRPLAIELLTAYEPVVFSSDPTQLDHFRAYLSEALGLHAACEIVLVGSSHVGYSLGPDNFGTSFSKSSDIDVAIIDSSTFDGVLDSLLEWRYPWHMRKEMSEPVRASLQTIIENAFVGIINPGELRYHALGAQRMIPATQAFNLRWFRTLKQVPTPLLARREINARLYYSRQHLERYQEFGLALVRENLARQMEGA